MLGGGIICTISNLLNLVQRGRKGEAKMVTGMPTYLNIQVCGIFSPGRPVAKIRQRFVADTPIQGEDMTPKENEIPQRVDK
jgi:hypothetical protein